VARLIITRAYPGDRFEAIPRSTSLTVEEYYATDGDALDMAKTLLKAEDKRCRKDPKKGPALEKLRIECDDGSTMDDATVCRFARRRL